MHLLVERRPQVVRHAALLVVAVFLAAALGRVERLVDRDDDVGDRDVRREARKVISAAWPAHARHKLRAPQPPEQLLQIGKRNVLPLADGRERNGAVRLAHGQIHHRRNRKPALGSKSHLDFLRWRSIVSAIIRKSRVIYSSYFCSNNQLLDCS
ncbi:hypothetical protein D3C83_20910 [compost metagenome]